ncbi:Rv3235 family protein [Leucobacter japonicus]|uniref:Rv3235 family protein n=1 Tax=Leucobacter japonicus TaxID=1461259 RepID=UPI0006A7B325|nr:Rv3235 family protein [Leucobacter japonicus]
MPAIARSRAFDDPLESVLAPPSRPVAPRHLHAVPAPAATPSAIRPRHTAQPAKPLAARIPSQPDQAPEAPPAAIVQKLALFAFEVLEGMRSASQIATWITPGVVAALQSRRALRAERECVTRDRRRRVAVPGPAHLCRPLPQVVEASVVLHLDSRSTAVALRFEHRDDRWRATDITVL